MRSRAVLGCVLGLCSAPAFAQTTSGAPLLAGRWVVTADLYGTPIYERLDIEQDGQTLKGKFDGDPLAGALDAHAFHFVAKDAAGGAATVDGVINAEGLTGTVVETNPGHGSVRDRYRFTALRPPQRPTAPPKRYDFKPTVFYRQFSAANTPVLTINPGDTVHTTTVDAGGADETGVNRVLGGNPQTGPFFIRSAMPGDTLSVHLTRLTLNRDYAVSDDALVPRALDGGMAVKMKGAGQEVRWRLDLAKGLASLEKPGEHLVGYTVPVHPMLGCVATAPAPARGSPPTQDSGSYGGNMDFNELIQGATLYLPVSVPGALLYLGDAHALQGDGELNGNALETSMDVEFTVDVIPGRRISSPRVESQEYIMAMGLDGSLDEAFKQATANMAQWLSEDHNLTAPEIAEILGSAAEYKVSEAADRNAGIVLKIKKQRLASLPPASAP